MDRKTKFEVASHLPVPAPVLRLHALNNVLGGPFLEREALQGAVQRVVRRTNESEGEHIRPGGWYSHSALVDTMQHTAHGQWKMLFNRLAMDQ